MNKVVDMCHNGDIALKMIMNEDLFDKLIFNSFFSIYCCVFAVLSSHGLFGA